MTAASDNASLSVNVTFPLALLTASESTSLLALVSVTDPAVAVISREVPVIAPVWVRSPPTTRVMVPPVTLVTESPSLSVKETARVPLFTVSESTSLLASVRVTDPADAVTLSEVAEMSPVWVRSPPTARVTLPPVMPAIESPSLSVKETAREPLFTESESTSLLALVRVTDPAVAVISSEVPLMGPVWVRFPPTARVMVPPVTPVIESPSLSVKETARVPLFTESEKTSLLASVRVTDPAVAVTLSAVAEIGAVWVRSPPTARVTLPPVTPASESPSLSVKETGRVPLLTESESTSLLALVRVMDPEVAVISSEVPLMGPV